MEYILKNAIAALLECQNTTLLGVNRLLTDEDYRRSVINRVKDPFIREFWEKEYASYDPRFRREAIAPIQNKVGQFLLSPVCRNILGQVRNRVDFKSTMDHQRIFLANLSKGRIGPDKSNLLGSLLVTQFQLAAMARASQPEDTEEPFRARTNAPIDRHVGRPDRLIAQSRQRYSVPRTTVENKLSRWLEQGF